MLNLAQRVFDDSQTWSSLNRDLSFQPADPAAAKTLTPEQVKQFNARGYISRLPVFGAAEVLAHRSYFDRLLTRQMEDGGDANSLRRMQRFSQPIWDIIVNPKILDYVEDLLGPNIVAWGQQYFVKLPGDGKVVSWHQDASYWPFTPARTVTLWLAVDDADLENGCMQVIPGTHTLGHIEFDMSGVQENSVLPQRIHEVEKYGDAVPIELKAGQVSLHADMLIHGSENNRSERRRAGLTIRYASTEVVSLDANWIQNSIVCRGTDPTGHWANVARPEVDYLDL